MCSTRSKPGRCKNATARWFRSFDGITRSVVTTRMRALKTRMGRGRTFPMWKRFGVPSFRAYQVMPIPCSTIRRWMPIPPFVKKHPVKALRDRTDTRYCENMSSWMDQIHCQLNRLRLTSPGGIREKDIGIDIGPDQNRLLALRHHRRAYCAVCTHTRAVTTSWRTLSIREGGAAMAFMRPRPKRIERLAQ
jgi:hypothetical protein